MVSDPKISVIIPVYNGAKMVGQAIQSVLAQTYPAHEIIVVDDGSKDDTPGVLASFGSRIRAVRTPNGGPSAARNTALKMVTGEWVAMLDHDDLWFRNRLERMVARIREYPDVNFLCCDYIVPYAHLDNRRVQHYSILRFRRDLNFDAPLKKNALGILLKEHFIGTPSAVLIRKDVIDRAGFFDAFNKRAQDYEYWMRCAPHARFLVMSDILFYKRLHATNVSGDVAGTCEDHMTTLRKTIRELQAYIDSHGLRTQAKRALADSLYFLGNAYYEQGRRAKAYGCYRCAFREWPVVFNGLRFLWTMLKKLIRSASFGALSKDKLAR